MSPDRHRQSQFVEDASHVNFVLCDGERRRAGVNRHTGRFHSGENVGRNMLVVEGDHIDSGCEGKNCVHIAVITDCRCPVSR
ncbi:unannotated protein [freshwater metagenome]|uniref:Unannotated protein n=1 Tax=freshwater metagenome TaxID=449393 RepID=A0A6J6FGP0_9ZZZZ